MLTRPELPQVSLDLLAAADVLVKRGHCKFRLRNKEGQVCAVGAILMALEGCPNENARQISALGALSLALGESTVNWNNRPERTAEEVINKFREVAYNLGEYYASEN